MPIRTIRGSAPGIKFAHHAHHQENERGGGGEGGGFPANIICVIVSTIISIKGFIC